MYIAGGIDSPSACTAAGTWLVEGLASAAALGLSLQKSMAHVPDVRMCRALKTCSPGMEYVQCHAPVWLAPPLLVTPDKHGTRAWHARDIIAATG